MLMQFTDPCRGEPKHKTMFRHYIGGIRHVGAWHVRCDGLVDEFTYALAKSVESAFAGVVGGLTAGKVTEAAFLDKMHVLVGLGTISAAEVDKSISIELLPARALRTRLGRGVAPGAVKSALVGSGPK